MAIDTYYTYSVHRTREAAESALVHYYAADIICDSERPVIRTERCVARDQTALYPAVWCVMFPTQ